MNTNEMEILCTFNSERMQCDQRQFEYSNFRRLQVEIINCRIECIFETSSNGTKLFCSVLDLHENGAFLSIPCGNWFVSAHRIVSHVDS